MSAEIYDRARLGATVFVPLEEEEVKALLMRAQGGDREARDKLVYTHMRYVMRLANALAHKSPLLSADDLATEGALGLLKAISKYDFAFGVKFMTYAAFWIRCHMMREITKTRFSISGSIWMKAAMAGDRFHRDYMELIRKGIEDADAREILTKKYRLPKVTVGAMMTLVTTLSTSSLDADHGGTDLYDILPAQDIWADYRLARARLRFRIQQKVAHLVAGTARRQSGLGGSEEDVPVLLNAIEIEVLRKRLFVDEGEEATLQSIAEPFGLTRERIRQIEARLLDRLADVFKPEWKALKELEGRSRRRESDGPDEMGKLRRMVQETDDEPEEALSRGALVEKAPLKASIGQLAAMHGRPPKGEMH